MKFTLSVNAILEVDSWEAAAAILDELTSSTAWNLKKTFKGAGYVTGSSIYPDYSQPIAQDVRADLPLNTSQPDLEESTDDDIPF